MKKKFLSIAFTLLSAFALTACSDSSTPTKSDSLVKNHDDYSYYKHEDTVDEQGYTNRTYYYINQNDSFNLTFRVNRNHSSEDFICGTAVISNDALNYMRYSLINTEGKTIVDYDKYAEFSRIGNSSYFSYTSSKDAPLYGIFDENGEIVIEEKYQSIQLFPDTEELFFLCMTDENTYDICKDNGEAIIIGATITDIEASKYHNRFNNEGKGLFALVNNQYTALASEASGEILATVDNIYSATLPDYFMSSEVTGNLELFIINDSNDAIFSVGSDYAGSICYAIKGYRYIYDDSNTITAVFNDKGELKEQPENALLNKLQADDTYNLLIEYSDKYILKDSTNKELDKFDKATYSLISIEDYGIGMQKGEGNFVYSYDGNVILQNVNYDSKYTLSNGENIIPITGTGKIYVSDVCNTYVMPIGEDYHMIQDASYTKYQIIDNNNSVVFEFSSEAYCDYITGTGYNFIILTDGIYTPSGKKIEAEGLYMQ